MAMTETIILSNSLCLLGHKPITTLDEPDDLTVAAIQAYALLLPGILSRANWRFAVQIAQLSESTETPPDPWQTVYYLPAGFLKTIRLYPNIYNWDIYQNSKLYTQTSGELYMEYVFMPNAAYFPPRFTEYVVYEIATYLSLSNAQRPDYYNVLESKRMQAFAMALASEAQNRPQASQVYIPVIHNRGLNDFIPNMDT